MQQIVVFSRIRKYLVFGASTTLVQMLGVDIQSEIGEWLKFMVSTTLTPKLCRKTIVRRAIIIEYQGIKTSYVWKC